MSRPPTTPAETHAARMPTLQHTLPTATSQPRRVLSTSQQTAASPPQHPPQPPPPPSSSSPMSSAKPPADTRLNLVAPPTMPPHPPPPHTKLPSQQQQQPQYHHLPEGAPGTTTTTTTTTHFQSPHTGRRERDARRLQMHAAARKAIKVGNRRVFEIRRWLNQHTTHVVTIALFTLCILLILLLSTGDMEGDDDTTTKNDISSKMLSEPLHIALADGGAEAAARLHDTGTYTDTDTDVGRLQPRRGRDAAMLPHVRVNPALLRKDLVGNARIEDDEDDRDIDADGDIANGIGGGGGEGDNGGGFEDDDMLARRQGIRHMRHRVVRHPGAPH